MVEQPEGLFPKKCPSCGRPRRFISFIRLGHSEIMPFAWMPLVDKRLGQKGPLFAECQACHDGWVWVTDRRQWVRVDELRRTARRKRAKTKPRKEGNGIGKLY